VAIVRVKSRAVQSLVRRPIRGGLLLCACLFLTLCLAERLNAQPQASPTYSIISDDFEYPTQITSSPTHPNELVVVERGGTVLLYSKETDSTKELLDIEEFISTKQGGRLLSVAFYPPTQSIFANYIDPNGDLIVGRFKLDSATPISAESMRVVIKIARISPNQHGSQIALDRDGNLFISVGDGETKPAPQVAQSKNTLLGKVLRIGINSSERYTVPSDNPFIKQPPALPEIWALGFRNPDQLIYDTPSSRLFVVDNRDSSYRIDTVQRGLDHTATNTNTVATGETATKSAIRAAGIYRGKNLPALHGKLIFADTSSGEVFAAKETQNLWQREVVLKLAERSITALGFDSAGELYLGTSAGELFTVR
jgi:glucose/arabinose dehydrogenase